MEAQVTIKLSPSEFDLMRDALREYRVQMHAYARDQERELVERDDARKREARVAALLERL